MFKDLKHLGVALLVAALLAPGAAFAEEGGSSTEVLLDASKTAATIDGSTFVLDDFVRAQKGALREVDGEGAFYSYYQGSSADVAAAVSMDGYVVVYVPASVHGLCDVI